MSVSSHFLLVSRVIYVILQIKVVLGDSSLNGFLVYVSVSLRSSPSLSLAHFVFFNWLIAVRSSEINVRRPTPSHLWTF